MTSAAPFRLLEPFERECWEGPKDGCAYRFPAHRADPVRLFQCCPRVRSTPFLGKDAVARILRRCSRGSVAPCRPVGPTSRALNLPNEGRLSTSGCSSSLRKIFVAGARSHKRILSGATANWPKLLARAGLFFLFFFGSVDSLPPCNSGGSKESKAMVRALYSNRQLRSMGPKEMLCGQFVDTGLTYPHGQRPVVSENRWLRFLYRGHRGYLRRDA